MRLTNYIKENINDTEVAKFLFNKINKEFLDIILKHKWSLYRGVDNFDGDWIEKTTIERYNRIPKLMYPDWHDDFNRSFIKKFGWPVRNGVFTTTDLREIQENFGRPYCFFPIGDYKFAWSKKIKDLNYYLRKFSQMHMERLNAGDDVVYEKIVDMYQDDQLLSAIKSENEISFKCKRYLLIDPHYFAGMIESRVK